MPPENETLADSPQRYRLDLTLRRAEGVLARVLGTAERRGYRPVAVDGDTRDHDDQWHLRMTVEGSRGVHVLREQLAKLHDCLQVEVSPCR